jgi:hypothetical protein
MARALCDAHACVRCILCASMRLVTAHPTLRGHKYLEHCPRQQAADDKEGIQLARACHVSTFACWHTALQPKAQPGAISTVVLTKLVIQITVTQLVIIAQCILQREREVQTSLVVFFFVSQFSLFPRIEKLEIFSEFEVPRTRVLCPYKAPTFELHLGNCPTRLVSVSTISSLQKGYLRNQETAHRLIGYFGSILPTFGHQWHCSGIVKCAQTNGFYTIHYPDWLTSPPAAITGPLDFSGASVSTYSHGCGGV